MISPATPFPSPPFHELPYQLVALSHLPDIHAYQRKEDIAMSRLPNLIFSMAKQLDLQRVYELDLQHEELALLDLQHDNLLSWTCSYCHLLVLLPDNNLISKFGIAFSFKTLLPSTDES